VIFEEEHSADVGSGRDVAFAVSRPVELCRAYSAEGEFLGVLRHRSAGVWHPEKVLARAETANSRLIR
jgi:hypothetical protein